MKPRPKTLLLTNDSRKGNAAVECALVTPLLLLLLLGAMDVGQFMNVGQAVNNASREGARRASRDTVTNVSEVRDSVKTYLANTYPNVTSSVLDSALTVTVRDSSETVLTGDLTAVPSGDKISVEVLFQYEIVRWTSGFSAVDGKSLRTKTVMRRE